MTAKNPPGSTVHFHAVKTVYRAAAALLQAVVLIAIVAMYCAAPARADDERPNLLFILVDDLRWDELGSSGHPFVRTPHIDRLAREGARFRNAFCTTPLCSPSRACILTGQYAHHHGIVDNTDRSAQSHRLDTFPRRLQQAGYETGFVGKWHMGNDATPRPGFDDWWCLAGQGTSRDPIFNENGERREATGYTTDLINDRAVEFVGRRREKPFCLFLAHKALHPELTQFDDGSISDPGAAKFIAAKRHQKLYAEAAVPRRLNVADSIDDKPALARKIGDLPPLGRATGTSDETIRDRLRMLAAVDEGVGKLLAALKTSGQLDRTVVVLTSDHGYFYGEHGLSVERRLAYEEAARIPLLVRYPRMIAAGTVVDQLALTTDIAPSMLELGRAAANKDCDGRSLLPLLKGAAPTDWRHAFLIEYYTDTVFPRVYKMGYKALRTERYKYIHYTDLSGMDELYDLRRDPYEMHNRISDSLLAETLADLKKRLEEYSPKGN